MSFPFDTRTQIIPTGNVQSPAYLGDQRSSAPPMRYLHWINVTLSTESSFDVDFNVPFKPQELIVKYMTFVANTSVAETFTISTSLIDSTNGPFVCMAEVGDVAPNIVYTFNGTARGRHRFTITNPDGTLANLDGKLILALEFVKYD